MSLADIRTTHSTRQFSILLGVIALVCGLAEFTTRFGAMRISRVERTIDAERAAITELGKDTSYLLIVGNSLLQEGTDIKVMNELRLGPDSILRYAVAQTQYLDWEYGLKALWRQGLGRGNVLIMMSPEHFASPYGRADYSAMRLLDAKDVIAYSQDLGQHPTETSRTILSHYSHYFGFRQELRKNVIGRIIPGLPEFMNSLASSGQKQPNIEQLSAGALKNLDRLSRLAEAYQARVAIAVPPLLGSSAATGLVCTVARQRGIPCLPPPDPTGFGPDKFRDGFHLNRTGAELYSKALARQLSAAWVDGKGITDTLAFR